MPSNPSASALNRHSYIKYVSLISLALQNVLSIMLVRYVRTTPGPRFIKSTFVVICEVQKAILSILLISCEERGVIAGLKAMYKKILLRPSDTLKLSIPALIYTLQNNLVIIAISNLDPATYVVNRVQCAQDSVGGKSHWFCLFFKNRSAIN